MNNALHCKDNKKSLNNCTGLQFFRSFDGNLQLSAFVGPVNYPYNVREDEMGMLPLPPISKHHENGE